MIVCARVAVQVVDAPGASVVTGQVTAPAFGSVTTTVVIVVVPVFFTRNDQVIVSPRSVLPSPLTSVTAADLVSCSAGRLRDRGVGRGRVGRDRRAGRVLARRGRRVGHDAGVDVGLGDRCAAPSRCRWSTRPGASVVTGQVTAPAVGSVTARLVIVVVPVFLTRNDQAIVSPRSVLPSPLTSVTAADLVSVSVEVCATGVSTSRTGWTSPSRPPGPSPVAVAVLVTTPASTSAWVIV